ncbi:MAG: hypothetical protein ACOYOK_03665 [Pseudobdellovibrionaceae bacterium]
MKKAMLFISILIGAQSAFSEITNEKQLVDATYHCKRFNELTEKFDEATIAVLKVYSKGLLSKAGVKFYPFGTDYNDPTVIKKAFEDLYYHEDDKTREYIIVNDTYNLIVIAGGSVYRVQNELLVGEPQGFIIEKSGDFSIVDGNINGGQGKYDCRRFK